MYWWSFLACAEEGRPVAIPQRPAAGWLQPGITLGRIHFSTALPCNFWHLCMYWVFHCSFGNHETLADGEDILPYSARSHPTGRCTSGKTGWALIQRGLICIKETTNRIPVSVHHACSLIYHVILCHAMPFRRAVILPFCGTTAGETQGEHTWYKCHPLPGGLPKTAGCIYFLSVVSHIIHKKNQKKKSEKIHISKMWLGHTWAYNHSQAP